MEISPHSPELLVDTSEPMSNLERIAIRNFNLLRVPRGEDLRHEPFTFRTLFLIDPESALEDQELNGPCDAINRDMLNGLYKRAGINTDRPIVIEKYTSPEGRIDNKVSYEAPEGRLISEFYHQEGEWKRFRVVLHLPIPT